MPWCEDCEKFWNPPSLPPDGSCPTCGAVIGDPPDTSIPWHFWILMSVSVAYLGYRYLQGIGWLAANDLAWVAVLVSVGTISLVAWVVSRWVRARRS